MQPTYSRRSVQYLLRSAYVYGLLVGVCMLGSSCEGYRCITGRVYDKVTGIALDSVTCEGKTVNRQVVTDSSGRFELCNGMGGCMPNCRDIVIKFSKEGYKPIILTNAEDTVFYLEPR